MSEASASEELPRPFYRDGWKRHQRPHAEALWQFHTALTRPSAPALDGSDLTAYFRAEREKVLSAAPLNLVPGPIAERVYETCEAERLPRELLGAQVIASEVFLRPVRFADNPAINDFVLQWAGSHARLLAHLAGASGTWQLGYADELARALFWVGRLMSLKHDIEQDRLFIPEVDLDQHGVPFEQLRQGRVDEKMKRLLWKQTIRAKNAFAQAEPLVQELSSRQAAAVKRWWLGGLEILNEIRRREYDVWSEPLRLSPRYRVQVRFQARFGRTTFRSR